MTRTSAERETIIIEVVNAITAVHKIMLRQDQSLRIQRELRSLRATMKVSVLRMAKVSVLRMASADRRTAIDTPRMVTAVATSTGKTTRKRNKRKEE